MDFAILADHGMKIKESEKLNKYLDLARNLIKLYQGDSDTYCSQSS